MKIEAKVRESLKMTRKEAMECAYKFTDPDKPVAVNLINGLEALGLLKFEEPKKPKYITIEHCGGIDDKICSVSVVDMIEALRRIDIICVEKA